jgi:hypothetical protein
LGSNRRGGLVIETAAAANMAPERRSIVLTDVVLDGLRRGQ